MTFELQPETLRSTVERARSHDPDAWEALYRHCYPRMVGYARLRSPNLQAAEDAVSESMARALVGIDGFNWHGSGFVGWMFGILRNVLLESHRSIDRAAKLTERASAELAGSNASESPEALVAENHERVSLGAAFELLDPDDRELLGLRVVGELTAAEVGEILGKSPGAVRTAQMRALRRLRSAMREVGHA